MTDNTPTWHELEKSARAEVRERADELAEDTYPEDTLEEMADTWVPIYTSDQLHIAADRLELAVAEPEFEAPEYFGAMKGIVANIYTALLEVITDEWQEVQAEMPESMTR